MWADFLEDEFLESVYATGTTTEEFSQRLCQISNALKTENASGNAFYDSNKKVKAKKVNVFKYVTTYVSKPFTCKETGNEIRLELGKYMWVEEEVKNTCPDIPITFIKY